MVGSANGFEFLSGGGTDVSKTTGLCNGICKTEGAFNRNFLFPIPISLALLLDTDGVTDSAEKFKCNFVLYLVRDPFRGAEDIIN
jgi:hypothetical protein